MEKYYITYLWGHPIDVVFAYSYEEAYSKRTYKDEEIRFVEKADKLGEEFWTPEGGRQFCELSNDDIMEIFLENFN